MALWVVDWAAAGKLAWDLAKAYWAYLGDVADDEQRESDRDHIIRVIALTRTQILDRIDEIEAGELRGEFEGFETIYSSYDPDPDNPVEEERLRGLIDDSARVLGRLGGHLDDVGEHPKMAFEMWVVYVALLYLRAQAMAERQVTYGANETNDAQDSFDRAISRISGLLSYLHGLSNGRFGPIVCKVVSNVVGMVCWYWYDGRQYILPARSSAETIVRWQAERARFMEQAYHKFEGVKELEETLERLQRSRSAVETRATLNNLIDLGIGVGEVRLIEGRVTRAKQEYPVEAKANSPTDLNWFS